MAPPTIHYRDITQEQYEALADTSGAYRIVLAAPAGSSMPQGERYVLDDQLHRIDGPACAYPNGTQMWGQYGKLHRIDGPAVVWGDGTYEWYLNDVKVPQYEVAHLQAQILDRALQCTQPSAPKGAMKMAL